ncbi:MAG: Do family serine endopeptidase [Gammaproteobacteria bacterium]|jgi:serine protease Do|nr:Do family serine endopeptidase [Gammaproteobacteria bacterium]
MMKTSFHFKTIQMMVAMIALTSFIVLPVFARDLPDFTPIIDTAGKSVVNIITINKDTKKLVPDDVRGDLEGTPLMDVLKQMFGDKLEENLSGKGPGLGSGTIVTADGYIVTNFHVIENADEIYVRLQDRREFRAKVIGKDSGTDIALLKIEAENLPFLNYADSSQIKVGEWVLAIGSPYGFENSVTVGVVSATGRSLGSERYVPFIQTDAAINPGNSGGPLLNLQGNVIGINSQIITESGSFAGLSFAVPANVIKSVVEQLKDHGSVSRGWLGLAFQDLDRDLAESFGLKSAKGALISKVMPDSPAAKAGMKEGDIITQFNGKDIIKATDLPPIVGMLPIDSKVPLKVVRQAKEMDVSIILSKYSEQDSAGLTKKEIFAPQVDKLHQEISVRDLEDFEKENLAGDQTGVMVVNVHGKPWAMAGVRRGDIITTFNGKRITSTKDFYSNVKAADNERAIPLLVSRPGDIQRFLAVKMGE